MKLPADCCYAAKALINRSVMDKIADGEIVCCRAGQIMLFSLQPEPMCRVAGDEVYRFCWTTPALGAHAEVCITRDGGNVALIGNYRAGLFDCTESVAAILTIEEWRKLRDALTEANFWSLKPLIGPAGVVGLEGYNLLVEGQRSNVYRSSFMASPRAAELRQLGQAAFDIAGLTGVRL
jgi:hypothetical protein